MDANAWNATFPVRQRVIYRRDSGGDLETYTRSTAFYFLGGTQDSGDRIMLEGVDYPADLERIRAF